MSRPTHALSLLLLVMLTGPVTAQPLTATWRNRELTGLSLGRMAVPGVTAKLALVDPRTGEPAAADKLALQATLTPRSGALLLEGVVTAAGTEDAVADVILRVEGVSLPTGDGVNDLLLAQSLVNKLPIAPLRTLANGEDQLALAMPADKPYVCEFRSVPAEKAVLMRLPLGFSTATRPDLRMKAPFGIVLMPTNPRWHFRSALALYYRLFPAMFARVEQRDGGWFFANEIKEIPNPQHFAFYEGLGSVDETHAKGLGMYPYSETSSETIQLPGPGLPKDYDEAMRQMDDLDRAIAPAKWTIHGGGLTTAVKHGGSYAYESKLTDPGGSAYPNQTIVPAEPINEPVVIEGWSKAENVTDNNNPSDYSIYVDCALKEGGYQFGQCALFRAGTHDWEKATFVIQPKSPLTDLRVYAMFRNRTGTAWFDDLRIYRQGHPDENLLPNGDFEKLSKREDIQYIRDNAIVQANDHYLVSITDNFSADVPPDHPLSLLRFGCNVDPDWIAPEGRPTPAGRVTQMYDNLFRDQPGIDGAYIDSVAAWCCGSMNYRRDQLACASHPLTYDPATFRVGQHGRFAMFKWLQFLQDRYHPQGKTVFGNMGPSTDAWTNYTVLDIIGIESSIFQNHALMGYHRFGAYHKPVLPMDFINLHKLDDRATAEEFVLSSAQWGEFPSTGRYVREGYQSFGDVCHTYYPALIEMSRAGWEPEPLTDGVRAERFGSKDVLYFTIRAPQDPRQAKLTILPEALSGIKQPVVFDAVQLTPVPAKLTKMGLELGWTDGADVLTVLRVSTDANARQWLLDRAGHHCANAAIVRGKTDCSDRLKALAIRVSALKPDGDTRVGAAAQAIATELERVRKGPNDLERTSEETELLDAQRALAEWLLLIGRARLDYTGHEIAPISGTSDIQASFSPGTTKAQMLGSWATAGRSILRLVQPDLLPAVTTTGPVAVTAAAPGAAQVRTALHVPVPGADPITIIRVRNVYFTPVVKASVERKPDAARQAMVYTVTVQRLAGPIPLVVTASAPGIQVEPARVSMAANQSQAEFAVPTTSATTEVITLTFTILTPEGKQLVQTTSEFRNLPMPPPGNLVSAQAGATATADSSYSEYDPAVTIDGVWETTGLHWTRAAWASQDNAAKDGHWLEIKLPRAVSVSKAWIYWAIDNNHVFSSRAYDLEVWQEGKWQPVAQVRDNPPSTVSRHEWPPVTTDRLRIHQLQGGGTATRPNIMWIAEVCLY